MDTSEGVKSALARPGIGVGIDWSKLSRETSDGTFPVKETEPILCVGCFVEDAMNDNMSNGTFTSFCQNESFHMPNMIYFCRIYSPSSESLTLRKKTHHCTSPLPPQSLPSSIHFHSYSYH